MDGGRFYSLRPMRVFCLFCFAFLSISLDGAKVVIKTQPLDAEIYVDGVLKGNSELEVNLRNSKQPYTISAVKEGYDKESVLFETRSKTKVIEILLEPVREAHSFSFRTEPSGAIVKLDGVAIGFTPLEYSVLFRRESKEAPWESQSLEFSLTDYETEVAMISRETTIQEVVELGRIRSQYKIHFDTDPSGASVSVEGEAIGTTPIIWTIEFERLNRNATWPTKELVIELVDYEAEKIPLRMDTDAPELISLGRLRHDKEFRVQTFTKDGRPLGTEIMINGEPVGTAPAGEALAFNLEFGRSSKDEEWPEFQLQAGLPSKYRQISETIRYSSGPEIILSLEPVLEIMVSRLFPEVRMMPEGVVYEVVPAKRRAILDPSETTLQYIVNVKAVTSYKRADQSRTQRNQCVNSFAVTPDGQSVIFCVTEKRREDSQYVSNMYVKRAADETGGITRLTQSGRFLDTNPVVGLDGKNILVFQSNRSDRRKPDIFRVNLVENRFAGGIARITSDTRFNFSPSYLNSNRELVYVSQESDYPSALPQISTVKFDGSLTTQLQVSGFDVNFTNSKFIYFVRREYDQKRHVFSVEPDGMLERSYIHEEAFVNSDCFSPMSSPDGKSILFVSDRGRDTKNRRNHDIYLMTGDGTGIQRLTENGSDDLQPAWSPTEPGVIFFLSSRGGAYNVWRMQLLGGG